MWKKCALCLCWNERLWYGGLKLFAEDRLGFVSRERCFAETCVGSVVRLLPYLGVLILRRPVGIILFSDPTTNASARYRHC